MTLKIEVTVPYDDINLGSASGYLDSAFSAIGFHRRKHPEITHLTAERGDGDQASPARTTATEAMAKADEQPAPAARRSRKTKDEASAPAADVKPAISTGEERVGPEDTAEDQAQDAADEAAEKEAAAPATPTLTHDEVRTALADYMKTYGKPAVMEDGPKIITLVCGEGKVKVSDVPDDQAVLGKVIAGIKEAIEKNPFKRVPGDL